MQKMLAIGMMSGTSVDGAVDTAAILTDGDSFVERKLVTSFRYEPQDGVRPIHHCTKAGEIAFRRAKGDYAQAEKEYAGALKDYIRDTFNLEPKAQENKLVELSAAFFGEVERHVSLADVIQKSTEIHIDAAKKTLTELGPDAAKVQVIGYHGQTLYHAPFDGVSIQVGDAQELANSLGIKTVSDFRSNDLKNGGQGAPLAPVYHRALLQKAGFESAAILNLGGTSNLTLVSSKSENVFGFDAGPANGLIDKYVKERLGLGMDLDSRLASAGKTDTAALQELIKRAIVLKDGRNYLEVPPPKSLDIRDYSYDFEAFTKLSVEDGCATLNAFTAECIAVGMEWFTKAGFDVPQKWILCGGGASSPNLKRELKDRIEAKTKKPITLLSADEAGWSAQGMEAELFAFLAVRSLAGLPITFPDTTGVASPSPGGREFLPRLD